MIKVKTIISGRSWTALTSRLLLLLAMCFFQSLMPAACGVTFTNDITLASAPEVSSDMVQQFRMKNSSR